MTWGGRGQGGEPVIGQYGDLSAPVRLAGLAPQPASLLEPGHRVGNPAAGGLGAGSELGHPQPTTRRFRKPDEDLVVGVRDACIALELGVQDLVEGADRLEQRAP